MAEEVKTVVTERNGMTTEKQMNSVTVVGMPAWKIVAIRAARVYLMTFTGLAGTAGVGVTAAVGVTFSSAVTMLQALGVCAILSLGPALVSAAWNTLELSKQWDASHPEMRA